MTFFSEQDHWSKGLRIAAAEEPPSSGLDFFFGEERKQSCFVLSAIFTHYIGGTYGV